MDHVEEREFVLRLEVRCTFPADYDGDDDGFAWVQQFLPMTTEIVSAATAALRRHPGWRVRSGNRGRSPEDEVTLVVERVWDPTKNED